MALYDYNQAIGQRYGWDSSNYDYLLANLAKYQKKADNYYKYGQPTLAAASGVASAFGPIGGIISAGIGLASIGAGAGIQAHIKSANKALDKAGRYHDQLGFTYGYDDVGQFSQARKPLNALLEGVDTHPAENAIGSAVGSGIGGALKGLFGNQTTSSAPTLGNYIAPSPSQFAPPTTNTFDNPTMAGQPANTPIDTSVYNPSDNPYGDSGYIPEQGFKKGGKLNYMTGGMMVEGGNGDDDIALVDTTTGQDTGKRVAGGELIVSEQNLAALKKALAKKDTGKVFSLMSKQLKEKPQVTEDGMIGRKKGGYPVNPALKEINIEETPSQFDYGAVDFTSGISGDKVNNGLSDLNFQEDSFLANKEVLDADQKAKRKADLAYWLPSAAGNAFDIYRFGAGMKGADTPIPEFHKSGNWMELLGRLKTQSMSGFSPEEKALAISGADRQYGADVQNIYNVAGGNAGAVLGNLGRANMNRYNANLQMAAADRSAQERNLATYGSAVAQDQNLDRLIFGDKYGEAKQTEAAGAKLANDAMMNMQQRAVVDQFYNPDSLHGQLVSGQIKSTRDTNASMKALAERMRSDPTFFKTVVGSSAGSLDATAAKKALEQLTGKTDSTKTVAQRYKEFLADDGQMTYEEFKKANK